MKSYKAIYFSFLLPLLLLSCQTKLKYPYAIKDFTKELQPYLTSIIATGIVGYDTATNYVQAHATVKELEQLGLSEHPILRAVAFRAILEKPGFHFDVLMSHLDDTAVITLDRGEFGYYQGTVSDDIIYQARWESISQKNKTVDEVITKHNYLRHAYTILETLNIQPKYYTTIKKMAQRHRPFEEIEYALYALAKFKKTEDLAIIKEILSHNFWGMGERSFNLMKDFPDTVYMEILEAYQKHRLYKSLCSDQYSSPAEYYFQSLASYKNAQSAEVLSRILNKNPFMPWCVSKSTTSYMKQKLQYAIWENTCEAYTKLRKQVRDAILVHEKYILTLQMLGTSPSDSIATSSIIKWY